MRPLIDALIQGRLFGNPQSRTSKSGNPFATAKLRTPMANGESAFINVIVFSNSAMTALMRSASSNAAFISGLNRTDLRDPGSRRFFHRDAQWMDLKWQRALQSPPRGAAA
jgi:hypothetical protein